MCSQAKAGQIIRQMSQSVRELFPEGTVDVILFGSYARHDETDESDIDVMYLVDAPQSVISERNWQLGEVAADVLMKYGVVISPVVENRIYFRQNADVLPFFMNVQKEGVHMDA